MVKKKIKKIQKTMTKNSVKYQSASKLYEKHFSSVASKSDDLSWKTYDKKRIPKMLWRIQEFRAVNKTVYIG